MNELLSKIDELQKQINERRPLGRETVLSIQNYYRIGLTWSSNAIEGNTLTLQETAMVLEGVTIDQKPLKEHLEIIGHRDAFQYVESLVSDKVVFSEYIIKNIHSLVLMDRPEDKGTFRRIPVRIMGAFHEPPQPYMVEPMMNELLLNHSQRKNKMHLVEAVALFHLDFEGIHPFIDGNGRTGRLLINLELMQHGYPAIDVKFSDRRKYYQAFDEYYRNQNELPMVEMVAGYVNERLEKYLELLGQV